MAVKAIPTGHHSVSPYLVATGVEKLIPFLEQAFEGECIERQQRPDGVTAHAEVRIGDSIVMMGEASEQWKAMPAALYVYLTDVDTTYRRAVGAGGRVLSEPSDMFYGDRSGAVIDPCGNYWWIATHIEDVSPEELQKRMQAQKK